VVMFVSFALVGYLVRCENSSDIVKRCQLALEKIPARFFTGGAWWQAIASRC
jgi:hypothetical protein